MANGMVDKERFVQLVRGGFPVNPVSGIEIVAGNFNRLQAGMRMYGWEDPRFVSDDEARAKGWSIAPGAESVMATNRNSLTGDVETVTLYNAKHVIGMPALEAMLAMSATEFADLQLGKDAVTIGPARQRSKTLDGGAQIEEPTAATNIGGDTIGAGLSGLFAVKAPYWIDGMHNVEGLAVEQELNELIRNTGLGRDAGAIARLLKENARARLYELEVVPIEQLTEDIARQADLARPRTLLNGDLVRDQEGCYRPKAGGVAVLEDKGDSLVVKGKTEQAYRGAIELAKAKGWTAIELTGKGVMLAEAWLEAKMQGLDVVNYTPTKEDQERLADSLAKEAAKRAEQENVVTRTVEQTPEIVELRPFVDAQGHAKTATVTYTVTQEGFEPQEFGDAKSAAACFAAIAGAKLPTVIRSVVRAEGEVEPDIMVAGTDLGREPGSFVKSADAVIDQEFSGELAEILAEKKLSMDAVATENATPALYSGMILRIEGDRVVQKVGRDPSQVVYHDIKKLSRAPKVGEVEDIRVGHDGYGVVADRGQELGLG